MILLFFPEKVGLYLKIFLIRQECYPEKDRAAWREANLI